MVLNDLFKYLNSHFFKLSVALIKQAVSKIGRKKLSIIKPNPRFVFNGYIWNTSTVCVQVVAVNMDRKLAVFDFDHTIINDNSDTAIMKLVDNKIPKEIKMLHRSDGWTAFMQGVFKTLHENNIQEEAINNLIRNLSAVQGMPELIKELNENLNFDVIIISDSNNHFIDLWVEENNLKMNILKVFSNPASFQDGLLNIRMYHLQDYCKLSTKNLCKGQIMEDFIAEQADKKILYKMIVYCGDGVNDFCPILRLKENDLACVRDKFKCVDMVQRSKYGRFTDDDGIPRIVKSDVLVWQNGYDIIEVIKKKNEKCDDTIL